MKNINKMRIIYPAEFNAEKEYLKTFFDYIGILVYDEKILNSKYPEFWYKHLKINNDPDGVDIVLNYYTYDTVPVPPYMMMFFPCLWKSSSIRLSKETPSGKSTSSVRNWSGAYLFGKPALF